MRGISAKYLANKNFRSKISLNLSDRKLALACIFSMNKGCGSHVKDRTQECVRRAGSSQPKSPLGLNDVALHHNSIISPF